MVYKTPEDIFTAEELALMYGYGGTELFAERLVKHTVFHEHADEVWSIHEFCQLMDKVPSEFRSAAYVEVSTGEEGWGELRIFYERPETNVEYQERIGRACRRARSTLQSDRETYRRLKAKFEGAAS